MHLLAVTCLAGSKERIASASRTTFGSLRAQKCPQKNDMLDLSGSFTTASLGIQGNLMFRYLITTFRTPQFQTSVIDDHYAFLDNLRRQGKLEIAGPFTDKSGGAYLIKAANLEEARALAYSDPVHTSKSSIVTVYEWNAK